MEPQIGRGLPENAIQSRHNDGNPFSSLTNQGDINPEVRQVLPVPGDPKFTEPAVGIGISGNSIQPSYDDGNTHSTLANQVDINSGLLQTLPVPGGHNFVEAGVGRGISDNTIQPTYDDGNTHPALTNQVDINSGLLQTLPIDINSGLLQTLPVDINSGHLQTLPENGDPRSVEPGIGRGISQNTIQPTYDDGNTHPTLTNQVDINSGLLQTLPIPDGHKSVEPVDGRGISESTIQSRYDDGNTHSTLSNQVDINSGLLQTLDAPGGHKSTEPEVRSWISENTTQPTYDYGNTHTTLNNQVDINEVLRIVPAPGDANAIPIVANQAETVPSDASAKSGGSPSGSNSANDRNIGMLSNPSGNLVQSVSPEPVSDTTGASGWNIISESPPSGISESLPKEPGYSILEYTGQADVDWRNLDSSPLSNPPIQYMVHQDGYDPNRIPASVFDSKSASPMDWSNASNESLFSIYMGNSFSGYQGMLQSGEFPKIEQQNKQQNPFEPKANEGSNFSPGLPTLPETSVENKTQQSSNIKDDIIIHEGLSKRSTSTTEESKENHGKKALHEENLTDASLSSHNRGFSHLESTNSISNRLSDDSVKNRLSVESHGSFAFPVLVTDLGKSSSFSIRSDKQKEQQIKHHHHQEQQEEQIKQTKQQSESPKTATAHAAARNRGCLSWFTGWNRCW